MKTDVKRRLLSCAAALLLCAPALPAWSQDATSLQGQLDALAHRAAPATFAIAVVDLRSGAGWGVNDDRPMPMMSDFKAPVAAAVLARVDAGTLSLAQTVTLGPDDRVEGSARPSIGTALTARTAFTVERLLRAAVSESDNTAVDALIRLLGGPQEVTRFLQDKGIAGMLVRDDERGMARLSAHLDGQAAPPPGETAEQERQRELAGYRAFLAAPPNTTTPHASLRFLVKLWQRQLISPASTQLLLDLMTAQVMPSRLRGGVPLTAQLADKTGTSGIDGHTAAWNDIGIISWPDGNAVAIAAYLSDSTASQPERDQLFIDLARLIVDNVQSGNFRRQH